MRGISDLRLSKNMKYTALYWSMRFTEREPDVFIKQYENGIALTIKANEQKVYYQNSPILNLDTHESFVVLELINRLFQLGYTFEDVQFSENQVLFKNFRINCFVWDEEMPYPTENDTVYYKSRLVSGVLEYVSKIRMNDKCYDYGLFGETDGLTSKEKKDFCSADFIYDENRLMKYCGKEKIVVVPDGTEEIESCAFWDNQYIEEVKIPDSVTNFGGDTFYNCKNLKKVNIPSNVKVMGNNPFAGCPEVKIENQSPFFLYENGILYNKGRDQVIYCSIIGEEKSLEIPEGVKIIGKHAFYLCDRFEKIVLPSSIEKMENNPFSGCSKLELLSKSKAYRIQDDVIYNGFMTSVTGCLNRIKSENLVIPEGIKTINRNSFWNCKGIKKITLPESLEDIGYNPFVSCSNIHFESKSKHFNVIDDVLYNEDCSKIICYPAWKAVGKVKLKDSVITLERGAFSDCNKMTEIDLLNVNTISKSCFTNCTSLQKIHCSDLVTYIGEWAFAYCSSLQSISVNKKTTIDNNAFSNTDVDVIKRGKLENYLIESDNTYTLSSMSKFYKGKIDSILIDPPYNSKIDYIGYKDDQFANGYGEFMKERLVKAYELLTEKGFLIINIDEGEVENLTRLCRNIFGKKLVSVHGWKKKHPLFDQNRVILNPNKVQTDYEFIIVCRKSEHSKLGKVSQPYYANGVWKEKMVDFPQNFDCFGTTSSAKDEIEEIFGDRTYFSTPKPVKLIKEFVRATTDKESLVLDFFAGSGTLAHAVAEMNIEDGGNRVFILVNNHENDVCDNVIKKRLDYLNVKYSQLG